MFTKKIIDTDSLFNKHVLVKNYMWESERRERWQNTTTSLEQRWTQLFLAFIDKNIAIPNYQKLVEFVFCLPGRSAPVQQIFSIMKNMWSDDRSIMLEQNAKALLICKTDIDLTCGEFFEKIKSNTSFLK